MEFIWNQQVSVKPERARQSLCHRSHRRSVGAYLPRSLACSTAPWVPWHNRDLQKMIFLSSCPSDLLSDRLRSSCDTFQINVRCRHATFLLWSTSLRSLFTSPKSTVLFSGIRYFLNYHFRAPTYRFLNSQLRGPGVSHDRQ